MPNAVCCWTLRQRAVSQIELNRSRKQEEAKGLFCGERERRAHEERRARAVACGRGQRGLSLDSHGAASPGARVCGCSSGRHRRLHVSIRAVFGHGAQQRRKVDGGRRVPGLLRHKVHLQGCGWVMVMGAEILLLRVRGTLQQAFAQPTSGQQKPSGAASRHRLARAPPPCSLPTPSSRLRRDIPSGFPPLAAAGTARRTLPRRHGAPAGTWSLRR